MIYQKSNNEDAPQTYVVKEFKRGDEGLMKAIASQSTVKIQVIQGPVKKGPTREFLILEDGKRRIVDPELEANPYKSVNWSLYINMVQGWTELDGQKPITWKDDAPHRLLLRMMEDYPRPMDRFDAGDVQGKRMLSRGRLGSLMTEMRGIVGKDVLPYGYRTLSSEVLIVIERRG